MPATLMAQLPNLENLELLSLLLLQLPPTALTGNRLWNIDIAWDALPARLRRTVYRSLHPILSPF